MKVTASSAALGLALFTAGCTPPPPPPAPPPIPQVVLPPVPVPTVAPAPPPPNLGRVRTTEFTLESGALKLPSPIAFDGDTDKLVPESEPALLVVEDFLAAKPEVSLLRIEGHTDTDGRVANNQLLSERRALAVARWLIGRGVKCDRLTPVGFGGTRPIVPNDSPAHRAQNRRIVIAPAMVSGKAVGGLALDGGGKVAGDPCK